MSSRVKIIELLTSEYGVDPELISPEATLVDLGLNSLTMAELICDLEESFGIEIALAGPEIATLADAVALTDRLVADQKG
jgi:acyl carrier protein